MIISGEDKKSKKIPIKISANLLILINNSLLKIEKSSSKK